jgi:DNA-binding transcriptional LysR family regulator
MTADLIDLRRLQHFVVVAESGSFTAAAAALHLSQQALSSSVQRLEKELKTALFRREGRRSALTPAGYALMREARPLLAASRTVRDHVRSAGQQAWIVGHTPALSGAEAYSVIEPAVEAFPDMSFTLRQIYPSDLEAGIREGTVQLGLRRGVAPVGDLAGAVVAYHRVRVAVPVDHSLAERAEIDITDLKGHPLALWAPPGASYYSDFLLGACRRAGFEPDYVVSRVQGAATVAAPLTTGTVALVTSDAGPVMAGRVVVIDLTPPLLVPVQAMWQRHTVSEVRDTLVRAHTQQL